MHSRCTALLLVPLGAACASGPDKHTLAELRSVEPDVAEVRVENGLDQAMLGYRKFLEEAPKSALTPEAMRRLADLKLEKEYGILGDGEVAELPAPELSAPEAARKEAPRERRHTSGAPDLFESDRDFERRAASASAITGADARSDLQLPGGKQAPPGGPVEAIELYDEILATYPNYPHNDEVLYQKARALDELGRVDQAIGVIDRLIAEHPQSRHMDEVQFRRAEYFFTRRKYLQAEKAYSAITAMGVGSDYYELALYKLGWTFYKQELHEEALHEYVRLLDYKVSNGYDFDHAKGDDEEEERRIADTYRVISLCFSNLGGPDVVDRYFAENGGRAYEDRIYGHLAEFYLEKLRYQDAAAAYDAFVALHPLHRSSPHFGMRVVEIYEAGGFPKLVLDSKKAFAATYGLQSEYWRHFDVRESPEVLSYVKANLEDLARHYHAQYQGGEKPDEKSASFEEASRWYRAYLASFGQDPTTPAVHHRFADLLLENKSFGEAAREYEHIAYDYPEHEQAAAAGYAAIYAHREEQKVADGERATAVRREAVASTFKFVDRFPRHEHAATVLGAAVDDLYEMKEHAAAIAGARRLIDGYPEASAAIRRSAWAVVANASLDLADYAQAEQAFTRLLEMTPADDESRQAVVDNLAAAIYKQGEQANLAGNSRAAADHFLRVAKAAPTSKVTPLAEYDASAALIREKDWAGAATALESLRQTHPEHELHREATKQMAFVRRQEGNTSGAAEEYERVAAEAQDPEARREALLAAGELYEGAKATDRALDVYLRYVREFREPLEVCAEIRFKVAAMQKARGDDASHRDQLREIVSLDRGAGGDRTARTRYLAAQSAMVLTEDFYRQFDQVKLVQPFQKNLAEKRRRMDAALEAFGRLVDYEVADVTSAATFYMAEVYSEFSRALVGSERPGGLDAADLEAYEAALEEEAFPFEEQAIEVHKKNLELLAAGIHNDWIDKSLKRLADLVPGLYAKFEGSSGFIASIDTYAYLPPGTHGRGGAAPEAMGSEPTLPAAPAEEEDQPAQPGATRESSDAKSQ